MIDKLIWWIEDKIFEYRYYKEADVLYKLSLARIENLEYRVNYLNQKIKTLKLYLTEKDLLEFEELENMETSESLDI